MDVQYFMLVNCFENIQESSVEKVKFYIYTQVLREMESRPYEKDIDWMEEYSILLGLYKSSFHEIYYDDYQSKKTNIALILKLVNGKVN